MADVDVSTKTGSQATKIVGADASGNESNFAQVDSLGSVQIGLLDVAPATQNITAQDVAGISLVGANGQVFYTTTPTAGSAATFALSGIEMVEIQANLLGGAGTMAVEVSQDGGVFWFRPRVSQVGTTNYVNSFAAPFAVAVNTAGMTHVRVRAISAWTGTTAVIAKATLNSRNLIITDSALPEGAATAANQATIIASVQILDDVPTAQNGAFVKGNTVMGQLDDTSTTAATEDAVAAIRITAQRAAHTNLRNAAGTEIGTITTPLQSADVVNGTFTQATKSVTNTPQQMNVSGSGNVANRRVLIIQAGGAGLSYGYTAGSQPFSLPNGTTLVLPYGSNVTVWVVRSSAAGVPVIVAEGTY